MFLTRAIWCLSQSISLRVISADQDLFPEEKVSFLSNIHSLKPLKYEKLHKAMSLTILCELKMTI